MVKKREGASRIRIVRWEGQHEVSQSRKVKGCLPWVAVPTRQGRGYCHLVSRHGAKGLGVWIALLELVANQSRDARGTLVAEWEDAASMARLPYDEVAEVLPTLVDLGWVEIEREPFAESQESPDRSADTSALPVDSQRSGSVVGPTGRDGTERDGTSPPKPPPAERGGRRLRRREADQQGVVPESDPPTSFANLAERAGMTVEQYREWHRIQERQA